MEYFHAYVCLPAVPPPAPSSRHAVRCHGTSLFQGYYELPRHLTTPLIVSHRFTARHQLIPFCKWNYARKTGLINRIIAPRANVFIFFCSLFSIFSTRLLSFAFFELSCMIFDFCLSLASAMVAFHFLLNNTGQLFHSRYRFIGLSLSPSAAFLCSSCFSTSFAHFSFSLFFLVTHVYHIWSSLAFLTPLIPCSILSLSFFMFTSFVEGIPFSWLSAFSLFLRVAFLLFLLSRRCVSNWPTLLLLLLAAFFPPLSCSFHSTRLLPDLIASHFIPAHSLFCCLVSFGFCRVCGTLLINWLPHRKWFR